MKFSKILSAQNHLLKSHIISVETDVSRGLHSFSIVGLPDKAVEEARDRVGAAIKNSNFKSPKQTNTKTIVSLAPADIRKEGPAFDLPIALGYLLATDQISFDPTDKIFVGELALDGEIRPIQGALSFARLAKEKGIRELYVPIRNAPEAALIEGVSVFGISTLSSVIEHISQNGKKIIPFPHTKNVSNTSPKEMEFNLDDIAGQENAKRGLILAAAGRHNIAFFGPPGTGKTMLAKALVSILPPLTFDEILDATEIHSIAGCLNGDIIFRPPVRAPHHTASHTALIGGGGSLRPGEVTLAHHGVLFLDEFTEFSRNTLEALRQPLEDLTISISRAKGTVTYPADFMLVAAFNPCPCGNKGIQNKQCRCTPAIIRMYKRKMSDPIVDRIDIWIEVSKVEHEKLMKKHTAGSPETDRALQAVQRARSIQDKRFRHLKTPSRFNSRINSRDLKEIALLSKDAQTVLNEAAHRYNLSGRGYHRTIRLARTIADIDGYEAVETFHILEALQYREKSFT